MPGRTIGRFLVSGLVWSALCTYAAGAAAPPPPPTRRILPEVRAGFVLQKAADYGVAPADYDGDGRADLSIKLDGGTWQIDRAANGFGSWDQTIHYWQIPSRPYGGPPATPVQEYALGTYTRAAFMLRGTPTIGAFFHDNVLVHNNRGAAVRVESPGCLVFPPGGTPYYSDALCHLTVGPNTYDTDTTQELAVGDFDGDGRDEVFVVENGVWSSWGLGGTIADPLDVSLTSSVAGLVVGDFDGDGRDDIALWSEQHVR